MQSLSRLCRSLLGSSRATKSRRPAARRSLRPFRPELEILEDRTVPSGLWSITGNFTGSAIPANDVLWFRSVAEVRGLGTAPATLHFTNQSIDFVAAGTSYDLPVANAILTLSPAATSASTTFDAGTWTTISPTQFSGRVFVSGLAYALPNGLPGGIQNVTWHAQVSTDTAGVSVNWEWAAAVYTKFNSDQSQLGVQALDDTPGSHRHFDPAGTPETYEKFVVAGGTNGRRLHTPHHLWRPVSPPSSLAGTVLGLDRNIGLSGVVVTATGVDDAGQHVNLSTTTAADGSFQFAALFPGTYTITEQTPAGYVDRLNRTGTAGGSSTTNQFSGIALNAGINGQGYSFGDLFSGSGGGGAGAGS